jgi:hypothetical protein
MAVGPSVTWTHYSVRYKVTLGINRRVRMDTSYIRADELPPAPLPLALPRVPADAARTR